MGSEYLKTIHGMITLGQILVGLAALITSSFFWSGGDVYWLFYISQAPAQIVVLFILFATWFVALSVLVCQVLGKDLLEAMGKVKILIMHGICLVLMIVAAAIDTHYTSTRTCAGFTDCYKTRVVIVMIFSYILALSYIAQGIFVFFQ